NNLIPVNFLSPQQKNRTYCILEDKKHRLWLGTKEGLILVSADRKEAITFTSSPKKNDLKADLIRSVIEDKNGTIWIATDGGGFAKVVEDEGRIFFKSYLN